MLEEHDRIVLTEDLASGRLKGGDVGTIVHIHRDGEAFEVEFLALDGNTAAVATVPASSSDLVHAWREDAPSGLTRSTSGKRVKSRSVVTIEAPCSSARAARCASITIAPFA